MNYVSITSTEPVVWHLTETLTKLLSEGKKTVWLLAGGSAIQIAADVSKNLVQQGADLSNLYVTLGDERYGELGHADENWAQLQAAGFALPGAHVHRVLQQGLSRAETTVVFGAKLHDWFSLADYRLGFLGIGPDGHTAGIKPHAFDMATMEYAAQYTGDDFERITMTPYAISKLDEIVVCATGESKTETLNRLVNEAVDVAVQPAQALKNVVNFTLYTNVTIEEDE
jgi:6-phosphogluconolactonase/glucosamine-6-phosphate isomerase/deaminase